MHQVISPQIHRMCIYSHSEDAECQDAMADWARPSGLHRFGYRWRCGKKDVDLVKAIIIGTNDEVSTTKVTDP